MNKLGEFKLDAWTVLGVLVVAYFLVPSFKGWVNNTLGGFGGGADVTPEDKGTGIECIYDGAVMTLGPVQKRFAPTTSLTGIGDRVFINDVDRGVKTDGSTLDVTYKDAVAIYYVHNASIAETSKAGYYVAEQKFTVPCASTLSTGDNDIDTDNKHQIVAHDTPSITFFNDDDGLKNVLGHPENMSASDSANIELKVVKTSKAGFSPYGKQYICARYNSTLLNKVELSAVSGVTGTVTVADVPTVVSNQVHKLGSASNLAMKCWTTSGTNALETVTEKYNVYLTTSTKAPAKAAQKNQKGVVNFSLYDEDWYRNTDTGKMAFGIQDDVYADVGQLGTANASLYISG